MRSYQMRCSPKAVCLSIGVLKNLCIFDSPLQLTSKEEDNQRAMAQCEAIVQEKEQQMAELQLELTKLQEHTAQLQAVLEKERSQQLEQKHEVQLQFDKVKLMIHSVEFVFIDILLYL